MLSRFSWTTIFENSCPRKSELIQLRPLLQLVRKIIDLLLYGNFFIAFCAVAMLLQTEWLVFGQLKWTYLTTFSFAATLCLYAIHRIVGIQKVQAFNEKYRYHIIEKYQTHILIYAVVGGGVAALLFFQLNWKNQLLIIIPSLLALGYVLPFFGSKRRLRDFHYIKIFLVALVWAFITVILPLVEGRQYLIPTDALLFLERSVFVFAITIPFDIRDLTVDQHIQVKTIPSAIGEQRARGLAIRLLFANGVLTTVIWKLGVYSLPAAIGIGLTYLLTSLLISFSTKERHDYFYTGLMDGTMILQFLIVSIFTKYSSFFTLH